jgi:hypothetical protein
LIDGGLETIEFKDDQERKTAVKNCFVSGITYIVLIFASFGCCYKAWRDDKHRVQYQRVMSASPKL